MRSKCMVAAGWSALPQTALAAGWRHRRLRRTTPGRRRSPTPQTFSPAQPCRPTKIVAGYLGKLWAAHDGMEPESRIRLLRNWVQLKGGRPSFQMLLDLIRVSYDLKIKVRGALPLDATAGYWEGACIFRFAETMSITHCPGRVDHYSS